MASIEPVKRYSAFLYPDEGKRAGRINLHCSTQRLYLIFWDTDAPLPNNTYNDSHKIGVAYQRFDKYQHFLDLVRNEGPISVTFRPEDTPPNYVVYAASEPPGEGEI